MTLVVAYAYLTAAIVFEVIGTVALKASDTFTRLVPSIVTLVAYPACFFFLALSLRIIPVGIAYAVWSGIGIVLIALIGWVWFKQALDGPALLGLGLIIAGIVVANTFSQSIPH
ncbi:MAG: multidrug efflux SMR transporter [Methyloceanibacter sp.]